MTGPMRTYKLSRHSGFIGAGIQLLILLLTFAGPALAANKSAGTTAAPFLKIGGGARPAALGNAFTAVADDVNTIAFNPAGLGTLTRPQFTALHTQWFQASNFEFVAGAMPTDYGVFGVGFRSLVIDKIDRRSGDTDVADGTFDSNDSAYTLSYGKKFTDALSLGINATYIRQELDSESASAMAGDLGLLWQTPHQPLQLGFALRHMGTKPKFISESDPLPMTTALGAQYRFMGDRARVSAELSSPRDNDLQMGLGVELSKPLMRELSGSLRAGYSSASTDVTDGTTGFTAGMGLAFRGFGFDMAWVPYGDLGSTFHYAFLVKF
jgi:long-subunit fatty acid transport protein